MAAAARRRWFPLVGAFLLILAAHDANGQGLVLPLTPAVIEEALTLAGDEKGAVKFLQSYVLQIRTGFGNGPLLGHCSTPFSRIVLGALAARKAGKTLTAADIDPAMVVPEFHVLVLPQRPDDDAAILRLENVLIASRSNATGDTAIHPSRMASATKGDLALYGVPDADGAIIATFPLNVVGAGKDVRAVFNGVVRGSTAITNCKECAVPLAAARLR